MKQETPIYTAIDLFSGMGGMSYGFHLGGRFRVLAGFDNYEPAVETFYKNHPDACRTFARPIDLREMSGQAILSTLGTDHIDVVMGGPPCQGFSAAGKRDDADDRNELVWEYVRLIDEIRPKCFLMENVPRIMKVRTAEGQLFVEKVIGLFRALGYQAMSFSLSAADYGVPQVRKRTFITGNRLGVPPALPSPVRSATPDLFQSLGPVTVFEALSDLPEPLPSEPQDYNGPPSGEYQMYLREGSAALFNHIPAKHSAKIVEKISLQAPGTRLYPDFNHSWYKLVLDRPSPTVKENHRAPFVHPTSPRVTTPRECARLQSFPDKYVIVGTKTAQLIQIGNAVPPLLAREWATAIADQLDRMSCSSS